MFDEEFLVIDLRKDLGVGYNVNDGGRGYIAKPVFQFYFCCCDPKAAYRKKDLFDLKFPVHHRMYVKVIET